MHPDDIIYPKSATKKTWEDAKSLADKTKKTGLAEQLKTAEAAWAAIPFKSLDPKQAPITDLSSAKAARSAAHTALTGKVVKAQQAVVTARNLAKTQSTNAALSSKAKTAAKKAYDALNTLSVQFSKFGTQDFDKAVEYYSSAEYAKKLGQLTKVKIGDVATATDAVWNRKTLKATGVTWKAAYDPANIGKKFKISASQPADDHEWVGQRSEAGQGQFIADLKLTKGSTNTAEFEA